MRRLSTVGTVCVCLCVCARALTAESAALPGPGLDVPVDADGDGVSTYGDRYAFNYWLALGGSLTTAMSSAEVLKDGVIDLSKFFASTAALLAPQVKYVEEGQSDVSGAAGGGGALALTTTCDTLASIVAPYGAPTAPVSVFTNCQSAFRYPTGADVEWPIDKNMDGIVDIDGLQGLWCSRGRPQDPAAETGIALLELSHVPPQGRDGRIPITSPGIATNLGFGAEGIVVRGTPPTTMCAAGPPLALHAMSTWPTGDHKLICRSSRVNAPNGGFCSGACGEISTTSHYAAGEPLIKEPYAIDVVPYGIAAALEFGDPEDVIFSDTTLNGVMIRRGKTPTPCGQTASTVTTLSTIADLQTIYGLALGNFKGTGIFGVYFVAYPPLSTRRIRRLVKSGTSYTWSDFASLPSGNAARSIAFDPISGDLFVSEESENISGDKARIWRIKLTSTGAADVRLFGKDFNKPNGIAFHPSGIMLVVEEAVFDSAKGNVLAVGGWRNLFKRGDANGDGTVDISDPIFVWNYVSQGGPAPPCLDGSDADDSSKIEAVDGDIVFSYLFSGGVAPSAPGPDNCGRDPTPDLLDCIVSQGAGCAIQ